MDFDNREKSEDRSYVELISKALQAIRKSRRMKPSEVAAAMRLPVRTYEHFERGTGRITYSRIVSFARATNSDPVAIVASMMMQTAEFAVYCADNKLVSIMVAVLRDLNDELGADIHFLNSSTLVMAFDKLRKDLVDHVRKRDQFAEQWLAEKLSKVVDPPIRRGPPDKAS